jgi:hypothetical protein
MTIPSSLEEAPETLWPSPRIASGMDDAFAYLTASETSSASLAKATIFAFRCALDAQRAIAF